MWDTRNNPKAQRFMDALRKAIWEIGPGDKTVLEISNEEFVEVFSASARYTRYNDVMAVKVEAWGSEVYVTCPKLKCHREETS